jgi:hypothetical protein
MIRTVLSPAVAASLGMFLFDLLLPLILVRDDYGSASIFASVNGQPPQVFILIFLVVQYFLYSLVAAYLLYKIVRIGKFRFKMSKLRIVLIANVLWFGVVLLSGWVWGPIFLGFVKTFFAGTAAGLILDRAVNGKAT